MANTFLKEFDQLLQAILLDYLGQDPDSDVSKGSLIFIKSACLASALWGLYRYQKYCSDQIFPDSADPENLEHHAFIRGITKKVGESDPELLARLLSYIRRPPAGGNKNDYEMWAKEVVGVKDAFCIPLGQGLGTVDVAISADEDIYESSQPTEELMATVKAYIDEPGRRPVTASVVRVLPVVVMPQDFSIIVTGAFANKAQLATDVDNYLSTFFPGQTLFPAHIVNIAVVNGADTVELVGLDAPVVVANTEIIRPGVINVP